MTRQKKVVIISVVSIVILGSIAAITLRVNSNNGADSKTQSKPISTDGTNYNPPTEDEKKETEQFKKDQEAKQNSDSQQTESPTQKSGNANIVISSLQSTDQSVRVSGFVGNVFEDGGTCTLTLKLGNQKVTGTTEGIADVNKTSCPEILISRTNIPNAGQWTAVLSYSSPKISGSSASQTVQVK